MYMYHKSTVIILISPYTNSPYEEEDGEGMHLASSLGSTASDSGFMGDSLRGSGLTTARSTTSLVDLTNIVQL